MLQSWRQLRLAMAGHVHVETHGTLHTVQVSTSRYRFRIE